MKGLTSKQKKVLDFIHAFIDQHHYSPSYREIMEHFSFTSPGSVYKYIQILTKKGVLEAQKHSHRSLLPVLSQMTSPTLNEMQIPLIGNVLIGYPLELFAQHQLISIPPSFVQDSDNTYLLQVQGDSLQEEWIKDGDLLLIEARQQVSDGEIILGVINQHGTILKRFFSEGRSIRLESQNSQIPSFTIRCDHIVIQGVLIGVMRLF